MITISRIGVFVFRNSNELCKVILHLGNTKKIIISYIVVRVFTE